METFESVIKAIQCELSERVCPYDIAEVKVGIEAPNDFSRNKTFDCGHPHLR